MDDKSSIIYVQNCEQFRSLNGFFWQVPLIMMTLNGGLWFSVASLELSSSTQRGILLFAVLANAIMIVGIWRLRSVMESLLGQIREFDGSKASGQPRLIQFAFQLLLASAAAGALAASFSPETHFLYRGDKNEMDALNGPISTTPANRAC